MINDVDSTNWPTHTWPKTRTQPPSQTILANWDGNQLVLCPTYTYCIVNSPISMGDWGYLLRPGCCQSSPAPMPNCLASWSETFSGRAQMAFDGKKSASGWRYRYRYLLALHMAHNSICNAYQAPLCHAIGDNCIIRLQMPNIALIALSSHFSPVFANWNVFSWEFWVGSCW